MTPLCIHRFVIGIQAFNNDKTCKSPTRFSEAYKKQQAGDPPVNLINEEEITVSLGFRI